MLKSLNSLGEMELISTVFLYICCLSVSYNLIYRQNTARLTRKMIVLKPDKFEIQLTYKFTG